MFSICFSNKTLHQNRVIISGVNELENVNLCYSENKDYNIQGKINCSVDIFPFEMFL